MTSNNWNIMLGKGMSNPPAKQTIGKDKNYTRHIFKIMPKFKGQAQEASILQNLQHYTF